MNKLKQIFSSSLYLLALLSIGIIILFTPLSIWFIGAHMHIPNGEYLSAYWVLGFSIATFCINLLSVPYSAVIISHENMKFFSYISIGEVFLKLSVAYFITLFSNHRVIIYAALLYLVGLMIQTTYIFFCRKKFAECRVSLKYDKSILKELGSFAGWNFFGAASGILRSQGGNILLNIFYGTAINAAYAISMQVNNAVTQMADNFMISVNPQITKYYASNNIFEMNKLINRSAKLSFYLTWILALIVLVNTKYILNLWLVDVPPDTVIFVQLILIFTLSEAISKPLITAMLATGKIRNYQLIVGGLQMLNLPLSYLILKLGGAAYWPLAISIFISQICFGARVYLLKSMINLNVHEFLKSVYLSSIAVICFSLIPPIIAKSIIPYRESLIYFFLQSIFYIIWTFIVIYIFGLKKNERMFVREKIELFATKIIRK